MGKVDSKGRIVLPQEVRDRLGITPGTEVVVREKDGKAIVEPEDDPERILERMKRLVEEASATRERAPTPDSGLHPLARKHAAVVRRGAARKEHEDE